MTRYEREMQVKEYTLTTWEDAFTVFVEGEEVHGSKNVERAIKVMTAIDSEFTATLINNESVATKEEVNTITVYHGTHQQLAQFDNREVKNYDSVGTYFTSNKDYARILYGMNVVEAEVKLNNPLVVNNVTDCESFDKVFYNNELTNVPFAQINKLLLNSEYMKAFKQDLINKGYDSIIFQDSRIDLDKDDKENHTVYIVLNADNITYKNITLNYKAA